MKITYSEMKSKFKLFASKQLLDLHRHWSAHETPDVIHRSHVDLLLAANDMHQV